MCLQLREALTTNRISFSSEFYSGTDVAETKQQLQGELSNFQVLTDPPKTPFGKIRKTFTGKTGGRNDDLCIALQLSLAGARMFYESPRYQTFRPENARAEVGQTTTHRLERSVGFGRSL